MKCEIKGGNWRTGDDGSNVFPPTAKLMEQLHCSHH